MLTFKDFLTESKALDWLKPPYNKSDLENKGVSTILANFIIKENPKNLSNVKHDFVEKFAKFIGYDTSKLFFSNEKALL